jgi:transcriptional regulator of acetoin/glycerol metabolism
MVTTLISSGRMGIRPHHVDRVRAIVEGRASPRAELDVSTSWHRCLNQYGLDPGAGEPAQILTSGELKDHREPLARLIHSAADELNRLHKVVGQTRYVVLLCNREGVAIDYRANAADAGQFKQWGIYLGGIWSEEVEGTNAIGTSIAERRAVTVHRAQHFRARHISLSCSSAPILDGDGRFVAALNVSCFDPTLSDRAHALTGALVKASARAIEERILTQGAILSPSYHRGGLPPRALKRVRDTLKAIWQTV